MSVGGEYLIVATASQVNLYNTNNWNTPHIFDTRAPVHLILQSPRHFLTVDKITGACVYTYDGRAVSTPKYQGLSPEHLYKGSISLGPETIAMLDKNDGKSRFNVPTLSHCCHTSLQTARSHSVV